MGERLTRQGLAERFGVSRQRIDEIIQEGRLNEQGATVDSDEADKVFAEMDPSYVQRERAAREMHGTAPAAKPGNQFAEQFNRARTAEQVTKAQTARLNYEIKSGRYVEREGVKKAAFQAGKVFASQCDNFPNRVAPLVTGLKDARAVHEILQREISELVKGIRDGLAELG